MSGETWKPSMTIAQAISLGSVLSAMRDEGLDPIWHFNKCGCCLSAHPSPLNGERVKIGWVINSDGEIFEEGFE